MNPRITPVLLAVASIATSASAQISATYIAKTKMVASAFFTGTGTKTAEIPIQTDLSKGKAISITNSARASVGVGFTNTSQVLRASITESGTGRYFSTSTRSYASTGSHQTLLTLKSAKPIKVMLRAIWSIRVLGRGNASGTVDIGNDGSVEFAGSSTSVQRDFAVTIDSKGLAIATTTRGSASTSSLNRSSNYFSALVIEILPPPTCLFFKHGLPCGVELNGKNGFGDRITLEASRGSANTNGVLVLGAQRIDVALPGTQCRLLVQPIVSVPIRLDATGAFSLTGTLPPTRPFALPVQVGVPGVKIATSNSLTIICP